MKKLLFVYNARSGKARIKRYLSDIINIFIQSGYYVESYQTQSVCDAKKQIAGRGQHFDLIVVAGGDGTLNEGISGMMHLGRRIPIGYIPSGSTNDFATSLKLPKDMLQAAKLAVDGNPAYVDIGGFNRSNFVYIAAFGAFTDVSYSTPQDLKNLLGHSAYIIEALKQFGNIMTSYHFRIERENGQIIEDDFIYGMVTNSVSAGGFKGITGRNIILDDGLFEVTLLKKPKNPLELQEIMTAMLTAEDNTDLIHSFKSARVTITSEEPVPWTLDGEYGGSHTQIEIENCHEALNLYLKSTKNEETRSIGISPLINKKEK